MELSVSEFKETTFGIDELIEETKNMLERDLADNNITLKLNFNNNYLILTADKIQIQQILVNLIKNSIESIASKIPKTDWKVQYLS